MPCLVGSPNEIHSTGFANYMIWNFIWGNYSMDSEKKEILLRLHNEIRFEELF